jgi:hypothetical protein
MKTLFVLATMVLLTSPLLAGDSKDYPNVAEWKLKDTGYHTGDMVKYKSNIFRAAYWAGKEPGTDPGWSLYDELYDETSHNATHSGQDYRLPSDLADRLRLQQRGDISEHHSRDHRLSAV